MTRKIGFLLVPMLASALLYGCGGCERDPAGRSSEARELAGGGAAQIPATPAPGSAELPSPPPELLEDCFVFVDAEPDYGEAPLTAHFTTELECEDKAVTYRWDFGDGTTGGNEANPKHTYEKAGDYIATVTVTAADGSTGSDEIDIFVDEPVEE